VLALRNRMQMHSTKGQLHDGIAWSILCRQQSIAADSKIKRLSSRKTGLSKRL
jgi:hypothetical protein